MQFSTPFFRSATEEDFWTPSELKESPAISPKLDVSKQSIQQFTEYLKNNILEGFVSAEQALTARKMIMDALDQVFSDALVNSHLQSEIAKYPKGKAAWNGAEISLLSRNSYRYEGCADPVWSRLKDELKQREKFLQSIDKPTTYIDDLTGECVTVNPAISLSTPYFTVKIK